MDDDFDDYESDISLYEESDEESDGEYDQDLNPTYLWTVQNSDRFEFPHDIEPFEESSGQCTNCKTITISLLLVFIVNNCLSRKFLS
jgi:hypothetical protein